MLHFCIFVEEVCDAICLGPMALIVKKVLALLATSTRELVVVL